MSQPGNPLLFHFDGGFFLCAEAFHFESKSRGSDNKKDKNALRYDEEAKKFKERYKVELQKGDPYYNKNFSLLHSDFTVNWKKAE